MKRIESLDYLRVGATFLVILLHTTLPFISQFGVIPRWEWWLTAVLDVFTLTAVPLFVMISGALLLEPREETVLEFYRKRVSRMAPAALFYLVLYSWWSVASGFDPNLKTYLIKAIVFGNPYTHLYFIFAILGLYLITPWLRKLVAALSSTELLGLTSLILLFTAGWDIITVWFQQSFVLTQLTSVTMFIPYIGYYLAGFYLFHYTKRPIHIYLFIPAAGLILMAEYLLLSTYGVSVRGMMSRDYQFPLVMILSLGIFGSAAHLNLPSSRIIHTLARASFGIYLIHQLILDIIGKNSQPLWVLPLTAMVFGLSFLATWVFSKLPVIGTMSGMEKLR